MIEGAPLPKNDFIQLQETKESLRQCIGIVADEDDQLQMLGA